MIRIRRVKKAKDGSRTVEIGVREPQFQGTLTVPVKPEEDVEEAILKEILQFREREVEFTDDLELVGATFEVRDGRLERTTEPSEEERREYPWMSTFQEEAVVMPPPPMHLYELYDEVIDHPKSRVPIVLGREALSFDEELTPAEISELETRTKKKIRKVA